MVNLENYSGFDKAAILLQILGEQLAMPLFNSISESDMLKLRVRSRELQNTPTAVKKLIMEEYYFKMMSNQYRNKPEPDDVFKFIRDLNDEQLFYLLSKEAVKRFMLKEVIWAIRKKNPFKRKSNTNLIKRIKRTYEEIYILSNKIDRISLEKKRQLTIPLIKEIL